MILHWFHGHLQTVSFLLFSLYLQNNKYFALRENYLLLHFYFYSSITTLCVTLLHYDVPSEYDKSLFIEIRPIRTPSFKWIFGSYSFKDFFLFLLFPTYFITFVALTRPPTHLKNCWVWKRLKFSPFFDLLLSLSLVSSKFQGIFTLQFSLKEYYKGL